jgi:hypothetical protein
MQPDSGELQSVRYLRRAGHALVAAAVVIITIELRYGLFISFVSLGTLVKALVLGLALWLRHSRAVAASLILLSLAILLRVLYASFYNLLAIWPRSLGFLSILWLPVFAASLLLDAATSWLSGSRFRPATAVAAVATLTLHSVGADTSTPYDGSLPAFVVTAGYVLLVTFMRPAGPWMDSLYSAIEPLLLVSVTWATSWCFPYLYPDWRPPISDLFRFFLPAFAVPAAVAVVIVRSTHGLWRRSQRHPVLARD